MKFNMVLTSVSSQLQCPQSCFFSEFQSSFCTYFTRGNFQSTLWGDLGGQTLQRTHTRSGTGFLELKLLCLRASLPSQSGAGILGIPFHISGFKGLSSFLQKSMSSKAPINLSQEDFLTIMEPWTFHLHCQRPLKTLFEKKKVIYIYKLSFCCMKQHVAVKSMNHNNDHMARYIPG